MDSEMDSDSKGSSSTDDIIITEKDQKDSEENGEPSADCAADSSEESPEPSSIVRYKYSRDELLALKCHPLSILRPECFDSSKAKKFSAINILKEFRSCQRRGDASEDFGSSRETTERERWIPEKRKSDSPTTTKPDEVSGASEKRRIGDPRDRLRKEQDGIVLSPQRRSFNSGCFVSGNLAAGCNASGNSNAAITPRRSDSPIGCGKSDSRDIHVREIASTRRIGSGRILNRDRDSDRSSGGNHWEFERGSGKENELTSLRGVHERDKDRDRERDDRHDRRSFGRDYDRGDKERRTGPRSYGSDGNERRRQNDRCDEPEWFSGGPTSQHDTIELHGFDDTADYSNAQINKKTLSKPSAQSAVNEKDVTPHVKEGDKGSNLPSAKLKQQPSNDKTEVVNEDVKLKPVTEAASHVETSHSSDESRSQKDFNLEDFLKLDEDFSELLTSGIPSYKKQHVSEASNSSGSRFKQWFSRHSPPNLAESREAEDNWKPPQEEPSAGTVIEGLNAAPAISIPTLGNSEAYFAPISPAASGSSGPCNIQNPIKPSGIPQQDIHSRDQYQQGRLFDILHNARQEKNPSIKELEASGRMQSVEELEAQMREQNKTSKYDVPQPGRDHEAFEKFLISSFNQDSQPCAGLPTSNTIEGLGRNTGHNVPMGNTHQQMNIPQDLVYKLLQIQQQSQLQEDLKIKHPSQQNFPPASGGILPNRNSPLPPEVQMLINQVQPNVELLQRPEAQNILKGLKHGELTMQNLVHQLYNTGMQPRHREVLASILKLMQQHEHQKLTANTCQQGNVNSSGSNNDKMHQVFMQQKHHIPPMHCEVSGGFPSQNAIPSFGNTSNATLSAQLLGQGVPHRVPSPRELIVHTQQIMQTALIKKKLEEQRENYRKRQEMQRCHSPNVTGQKMTSSPSSHLAFTPTSVLRKLTADKDLEVGDSRQVPMQQPQGHPLNMYGSRPDTQDPNAVGINNLILMHQPYAQHQHFNWNPVEAAVPKPKQGRPILKSTYANNKDNRIPPTSSQNYCRVFPSDIVVNNSQVMLGSNPMDATQGSYQHGPPVQQKNVVHSSLMNHTLSSCHPQNMTMQHANRGPGRALRSQNFQQQQCSSNELNPGGNLAQWFSGAGQMGSMPPIPTANTLSLEEIERHQQASAVLN